MKKMVKLDLVLRLQKLCETKCRDCPCDTDPKYNYKWRCCHEVFCEMATVGLEPEKLSQYKRNKTGPKFIEPNGRCRVKPEDRAFCTCYMCGWALEDRVRTYAWQTTNLENSCRRRTGSEEIRVLWPSFSEFGVVPHYLSDASARSR